MTFEVLRCVIGKDLSAQHQLLALMINELSTLHYPPSLVTDAKSAPIKDIFSLPPSSSSSPFNRKGCQKNHH